MSDFLVEVVPPAVAMLAGAIAAIVLIRRTKVEIPPGVQWRWGVSLLWVGLTLGLSLAAGFGFGFITVALSLAVLFAARVFVPGARETPWHWPTVLFAFLVIPIAAFAAWALV